jgi:hypothetical protein
MGNILWGWINIEISTEQADILVWIGIKGGDDVTSVSGIVGKCG